MGSSVSRSSLCDTESTLIVRRDGDTGASPLVTSIIKLNGDSGGYGKSHSNNRLSFSDTVLHSKVSCSLFTL
jgi:hypothetical protein